MKARIVSVNVGQPREVPFREGVASTAIFKSPVEGRVAARDNHLTGDGQADPRVHGGPLKAIYLYPFEHYEFWSARLPDKSLSFGMFGENLTAQGMTEDSVHIGDRFAVGTCVLQVTQPRMPCYKLGIRFGQQDMVKRFLESRLSGIYFSIAAEGELGAGDEFEQVWRDPRGVSVSQVLGLYTGDLRDADLLSRALATELPEGWKEGMSAKAG